ncbi:MAG: DegV family protein, partial [Firmicutes bacterium]|nr:DegV family protein [Bacillota bacterium]
MVRIYADSTNDLGPELIARTGVQIIPLYVTIGDTTGRDGVEITPDGIYEWANKTKQTPKTAAFPPKDVEPFIKDAKAVGDDIIFIGISEEMSATCNVFRLAAQQQEYEDHTFVVDSRNLSTGIGLIILEAARLRDEGKSAAEIVEGLKTYIDRSRASFVIDTLVYLARGGRCSTVTALLASTLKIKPKIVVEKGAMHVANLLFEADGTGYLEVGEAIDLGRAQEFGIELFQTLALVQAVVDAADVLQLVQEPL